MIGVIALLVFIKYFIKKESSIFKLYDTIERKLVFNSVLRNLIQSYLGLSISTLLALTSFDNPMISIVNVLSLLYLIIIPGLIAYKLY